MTGATPLVDARHLRLVQLDLHTYTVRPWGVETRWDEPTVGYEVWCYGTDMKGKEPPWQRYA